MTMFLKMFNKIRNINSSNVLNQSVYQYNDKTLLQQLDIDLHFKKNPSNTVSSNCATELPYVRIYNIQ